VLQDRSTYEIMRPEELGLTPGALVLGKHSGRHAFIATAFRLGYDLAGGEVQELFAEFKSEADRIGSVTPDWFAGFLSRRVAAPREKRA
jgi:2-isopropylmalate synthase